MGRTTQRRQRTKSSAKWMYGQSAVCIDSIRDDDNALLLGVVVVARVSTYHDVGRRSAEAFSVLLSLQWGYAHRASAAESGKTKHEVTESNAMAFVVL